MESLDEMRMMMEKITKDAKKVMKYRNYTASVRVRKNAQILKEMIFKFRKDIKTIMREGTTDDTADDK